MQYSIGSSMNFFASATISALSSLSSTTVERLWRCFVTAVSQFPSQLSAGDAHPDCEVVRLRLLELLIDRLLHQALRTAWSRPQEVSVRSSWSSGWRL